MIYKFKQLEFSKIIIRENNDGSKTSFFEDPANTDYQAFLLWKAQGNEPLPADEPQA